MCPCSPSDNSINITPAPPFTIDGLPVLSFGQFDFPQFDLPTDLIEDLVGLLKKLASLWPSGIFSPNPELPLKTIFDYISNLLSQLAPFLQLYNFFLAVLQLILCIIEVLCAIPDPFAVAAKLQKLFSQCLPPFFNLLPFLALIAMIIALLLLILALIEYLITVILAIIEAIIRNLIILSNGLTLQDATATLAAINKIASLLCFIENLLAILLAIAAILAVIESLALFGGTEVCGDSSECCDPVICPPWLKNNREIPVTEAKLVYYPQVGINLAEVFPDIPGVENFLNIPPKRAERWQIMSMEEDPEVPIKNIVTAIVPFFPDFWPDDLSFKSTTSPKRSPYTVDLTLNNFKPSDFMLVDVIGTRRTFIIKNCVVVTRPIVGYIAYDNSPIPNTFTDPLNGTLSIEGGQVFEEDGETPFMIGEDQATLNTFLHRPDKSVSAALVNDEEIFTDISFVWKPNHGALAGYNLTTVGCMPEVSIEKGVFNSIIVAEGIEAPAVKLPPVPAGVKVPSTGFLPNVVGTQVCISDAIAVFRKDISNLGAANFQASVMTCLQDLKDQTTAALCGALTTAVSIFKSTITLDTDVQFITRPITVSVNLKDGAGTALATNIPGGCAEDLASKLRGEVTFGEISKFTYDGYTTFNALITSDKAGEGTLTTFYDSKVLSQILQTTPTSIEEIILPYTFVDGTSDTPVRRDPRDVA